MVPLIDLFPDLLLARMVVGDREGHELFERDAVLTIDLEQGGRDRGEPQALAYGRDRDEKPRGDIFLGQARFDQRAEGTELVERMQRDAHDVFGERVLFGNPGFTHDARDGLILGHPLGLHQQFEGPETATAGGDFEHAGFLAAGIEHGADVDALEQGPAINVLGQILDRKACFHAPHILLAQHQLRKRDVARGAEHELGQCLGHGVSP